MLLRSILFGVAAVGLCLNAEAAKVTSFVVTCVDRQEATDDDVYLAGVRDGQPVPWGPGHQKGTSQGNSIDLTNDRDDDDDVSVLTLDAKSLAEMTFNGSLEIAVKEKDVTAEQVLGTIKITPDDGTKKVILKGGEGNNLFEYHVDYTVAK
jgi:hypothetical protein